MSQRKNSGRGRTGGDHFGRSSAPNRNITDNYNICPPTNDPEKPCSPWGNNTSGYASASPPNTGSSGSSANSQCYGQSPGTLSVDSLISSLLDVAHNTNFCTSPDTFYPSNGGFGSPICGRDCTDPGCDCRTVSRRSIPIPTKMADQFRPLHNSPMNKPSAPMDMPSAPMMPLHPIRMARTQEPDCQIHSEHFRMYCQTCSHTYCSECSSHTHRGHVTVNIRDAIESAAAQAQKVMDNARMLIALIREDLQLSRIQAESVTQKSRQAKSDASHCTRTMINAIEHRDKQLSSQIDAALHVQLDKITDKDQERMTNVATLERDLDVLVDAMETSILSGDPADLFVAKDLVAAQIYRIRQLRQNSLVPQDNWLSFAGPESTILHAIAHLGSIVVSNPGPIGDRRAVRGRGPSPQSTSHQLQPFPLGPVPRGRPVPCNGYPVTVRAGINWMLSVPKPFKIIGNDGVPSDNLCRPWGVACDREGHIIIADRSNNRVQIYREDGTFVRRFGSHGSGAVQFDRPAGIAVDGRRRVIVADKDNHRVQIVTMEGSFVLTFGEKGNRPGQFNYPWDVAVNSECQIVVSDTRNHRIQLFSADGIFLRKYGFETTPGMWKSFDSPRGVSFNPEGNVLVTDFNNHRVVVVDADFVTAKLFGSDNTNGQKQFLRPQGLVVDDEGNVIIADSRNHRIQVFDSAGTLKWKFGVYGKNDDEMDRPSGVALTPSGRIVVVDFGNNRVIVL